jgi:hypothetical protein
MIIIKLLCLFQLLLSLKRCFLIWIITKPKLIKSTSCLHYCSSILFSYLRIERIITLILSHSTVYYEFIYNKCNSFRRFINAFLTSNINQLLKVNTTLNNEKQKGKRSKVNILEIQASLYSSFSKKLTRVKSNYQNLTYFLE